MSTQFVKLQIGNKVKRILATCLYLFFLTDPAFAQLNATKQQQEIELGPTADRRNNNNIYTEYRDLPFGRITSRYRPQSVTVFVEIVKLKSPLNEAQAALLSDLLAPLKGSRIKVILPPKVQPPEYIETVNKQEKQIRLYIFEKALIAWRYNDNNLIDSIVVGACDCFRYQHE